MASDENRLSTIFETTKVVCVGRFLIDVPTASEVVYGPARLPVEIWRHQGEGLNLDSVVKNAVKAVEDKRWLALGELKSKTSLLGNVIDGIGPNHKIVFGIGRGDSAAYNVQSFISTGDDLYLQEFEAYGKEEASIHTVQEAKEVASLLTPRNDDESPIDSGICLDGAFLKEPSRYMVEAVSLGIRLKNFDDVHVSIQMTKKDILIESDAMEPRLKAAERDAIARGHGAWYKRIKFFRRGERKIGDWVGFEVAARKPAQKVEEESHEFAYLSQGEPKNPLLPVLDVKLHTGVKVNVVAGSKPSITDDEALYLWDRILTSIRPRPANKVAK